MPFYDYFCPNDNCVNHKNSIEKMHSINQTPKFRCDECNAILVRGISQIGVKNPSKAKQHVENLKKGAEYSKPAEMVPNYEGEETKTWEEAKEVARKKGTTDPDGTSRKLTEQELATFDVKIKEEKKAKVK